jgi:hypothetical protein
MKKYIKILALFHFALLAVGCAGQEMVMTSGMRITATNLNGTISITAGEGMERRYVWENKQISVNLRPRVERWLGSLGAYSPGGGDDVHTVVEEGQQHFCSEKEALEWLSWQDNVLDYVYTPDGMVVGYRSEKLSSHNSFSLNVNVWQVFINGQRPDELPGAEINKIQVSYNPNDPGRRPLPGKFVPSNPKVINGRLYSGKSIDYMEEKRLSSAAIEKVIKFGKIKKSGNNFVYYGVGEKFDPFKDLMWVEIDNEGRVVLFGK